LSKLLKPASTKETTVVVTGNTAIDALNYTVNDDYQSEILEKHKNALSSSTSFRTALKIFSIGSPRFSLR
jgi:UDP-N-acetylglucosamine 2-epimerase